MALLRFLLLSLIDWVLVLLAYPIVPFAVLLADEKTGRLPKMFRWYETHDALGWGAGTYEKPIGEAYTKYGKRVALIFWLWRNKAYTFSNKFRATPNYDTMVLSKSGREIPPRFGPYWAKYVVRDAGKVWFDIYLGFGFFKFYLYLRMGWKLKPYFDGHRPVDPSTTATGILSGISLRSDDWDELPK